MRKLQKQAEILEKVEHQGQLTFKPDIGPAKKILEKSQKHGVRMKCIFEFSIESIYEE